ncbi:nucleoside triphosphate pyrophosphohydrolase ham1 [Coemansia sp. RSA 1807]|nr:nucleoside triphosphate pyrophosphohydrolase ham1 [Coemansia sp. RSA 921]KAJ2280170.1 nucleoside triphosphate pyrophosphohydrolase ham1 [Coemansia sp. RSA 451]KAJ2532715.1 nucleoside triphosphate pyrophosphohydrolase ham1 [Coemansia sp. RSA 1937]KAJ2578717.1 nucleoside triphosphate pyrophosphohydrolase ham1 [Coemansia sp. RSA 1807]KAJ2593124.1 nucleoside triphosphate pyrophosphohydrolase ham1 [Coemansia sp. RSA 1797]
MALRKLTFVTGNKNKLREMQDLLCGIVDLHNASLDLEEIQGTTQDVARAKCKQAAQLVNGPVITEDVALGFNAMNGLPGAYIKWFLNELGPHGLHTMLAGFEDKSGAAVCTVAYCEGPGSEPVLFEGIHKGTIVAPRGPAVFGWNPVFQPDGSSETYAEMSDEVKNSCSHRFLAVEKLKAFLAPAVIE